MVGRVGRILHHGRSQIRMWALLHAATQALLVAASPSPRMVGVQALPVVLTVQLHTVTDAVVPGITVQVIDAASDQALAEGTTNGVGQARFVEMPPTEVRVRLTGNLPDGTVLRHTRQDQHGIWVNLPAHDWVMALRVDTDGLIFPDLGLGNAGAPDAGAATAIAAGILPTIYPTARVAPSASRTVTPRSEVVALPTSVPQTSPPTPVGTRHATTTTPASDFSGITLLVVLLAMIGGVLWMSARGKL